MTSLLQEFKALVAVLNAQEIPYALCGGLALAVHGFPRATVDIDLLVPEENVKQIKQAATSLGFEMETHLGELAKGQMTITRLTKFFSNSEDFVSLDIVHVTPVLKEIWSERELLQTPNDSLWVLSKSSLIRMKRLRNSKQDIADIERLKDLDNEN